MIRDQFLIATKSKYDFSKTELIPFYKFAISRKNFKCSLMSKSCSLFPTFVALRITL